MIEVAKESEAITLNKEKRMKINLNDRSESRSLS